MATPPRIIDQYGNPISVQALKQEFAPPTLGGIHSVWQETVISGLTPQAMGAVLKQAERGYPDRFFTLATEMEERDLHYAAVLGTRKRAITGIEPIIVAASKDAEDEKIAAAVREFVQQPEFIDDYLTDLLDALGKGYSVIETMWERSASQWWPARFEWRDQRHFVIDQRDGRTLRFKAMDSLEGDDLPSYKFSIHRPKLKSGLPIRAGLARLNAWAFLFKSYTLKDWMAFLEIYGMPLRVGRYGKSASHDEKRVLLTAVRNISTDAAAIIPKEMEIEFIEAKGGTGNAVFSSKAEYLDRQMSKAVLGQTMTTDDGSSLGQAAVHENVRHDIARADARQTAITANRDVIRPFVDLNYGPRPRGKYPTLVIPITEAEDIKALADVISQLVPLGLEVSMQEVRERVGFGEPEEGHTILKPSAAIPDAADPVAEKDEQEEAKAPKKPGDEKAQARRKPCQHCGGFHGLAADERPELESLAEDALAEWESDLEPIISPLRKLFERATSYAQIESGLDDLIAKMDVGPLADRLAKLQMKARGLGDTGDGRG